MSRSEWQRAVAQAVSSIPRGQTAGYALVALLAGKPGASRAVVQALHALDDVPWWRVIKSDGTVAKEMLAKQAPRLKAEGVALLRRRVPPAHRWAPWASGASRSPSPAARASPETPSGRSRSGRSPGRRARGA
ncbi:MAG: MGMT family protein [Myxococcus sp.]|nr:MGMT family protein [Myxococcus sp.]